jgi:hypothetical protein
VWVGIGVAVDVLVGVGVAVGTSVGVGATGVPRNESNIPRSISAPPKIPTPTLVLAFHCTLIFFPTSLPIA